MRAAYGCASGAVKPPPSPGFMPVKERQATPDAGESDSNGPSNLMKSGQYSEPAPRPTPHPAPLMNPVSSVLIAGIPAN